VRRTGLFVLTALALLAACVAPALGATPKPKLGSTVVLKPAGGTVLVKPRGGKRFKLKKTTAVPVGSLVDTTHGLVKLTSARESKGTQSGVFSQGAFVVTQQKSDGLTDLQLTGGNFGACTAAQKAGKPITGAASKRRRLFGSAHGRFRTRGRNSSATVRGTQWLTEDRCDGTLTKNTSTNPNSKVDTVNRDLKFTLDPGYSIHYFCNTQEARPDMYCIVLLAEPDKGLVGGGLLTRIDATQYDVNVTWPNGGTQTLSFQLTPPDPFGFRQSVWVCPVTAVNTYTFTWVLNGIALSPPLTDTIRVAAQPYDCLHQP
jgi:hypothetical protein